MDGSTDPEYTHRLLASESAWRRFLGLQAPYRWNIRRVVEGRVLDVGCGVGRNLVHLGGHGVGIDTNETSVAVARSKGLVAYTPDGFAASSEAESASFGTLLFAHVLEHMTHDDAVGLMGRYLEYLQPGGRIVIVVPQEAGFRADPTHVDPVSEEDIHSLARHHDLAVERIYSFPFPRMVGQVFRHNETVGVLRRGSHPAP